MKCFASNLTAMSVDEMSAVNGGESAWYWILYAAGATGRFLKDMATDAHNNPIRPSEYR
jgi:hypothetical protein